MDTAILEEIGFSPGEVRVYLQLLELGESTIGPLGNGAGVTLAKTYPILEKLKGKGLITEVNKGGVRTFQAFNPERIIDFLSEKEEKIEAQKQDLKKLIPILKQQKGKTRQYAAVYETFNGMRSLYNEALAYLVKTKEDFIGFSLGDEYAYRQAILFFKQYDRMRREQRIMTRLIALDSQRQLLRQYLTPYFKVRFLPYSVPHGVIIYGDVVATLLWREKPTAFVIHSQENAQVYKNFFEDMWRKAKP